MLTGRAQNTQEDALLQAFLDSPCRQLNSVDIRNVPGIGQATARLSGLRRRGYVFGVAHVKGTSRNMYVYTLLGHKPPEPPDPLAGRRLLEAEAAREPDNWAHLHGRYGQLAVLGGRLVFIPKRRGEKAILLVDFQARACRRAARTTQSGQGELFRAANEA